MRYTKAILTFLPIPAVSLCNVRRDGFALPLSSFDMSPCDIPVISEHFFCVILADLRISIIV